MNKPSSSLQGSRRELGTGVAPRIPVPVGTQFHVYVRVPIGKWEGPGADHRLLVGLIRRRLRPSAALEQQRDNADEVIRTHGESANAKRQPREAAAIDARMQTQRNGCLPLAARSG